MANSADDLSHHLNSIEPDVEGGGGAVETDAHDDELILDTEHVMN